MDHKVDGLKQQKFYSHRFGGQKSEISCQQVQASPKVSRRESVFVSLSFWWLLALFGFPWLPEAEASILWPLDANGQIIGKDPDAGKDRRQEEKRATEDELDGWHHRLNGHELG